MKEAANRGGLTFPRQRDLGIRASQDRGKGRARSRLTIRLEIVMESGCQHAQQAALDVSETNAGGTNASRKRRPGQQPQKSERPKEASHYRLPLWEGRS
jgi:hypothetical protein